MISLSDFFFLSILMNNLKDMCTCVVEEMNVDRLKIENKYKK